ncbi:hypothetical protein GCM10020255_003710 [Rhodococcus baikonurensis]
MVHRNARLTPAGRRILVQRVCEGQPVAHVAKDMGVSRTCAQRYAEHARSMPAVAGRMWTPRRQALRPHPVGRDPHLDLPHGPGSTPWGTHCKNPDRTGGVSMTEISFARQLARHVTADHKLTAEITDWMKLLLFDYYAITTGGAERDSAVAIRSAVSTAASQDRFFSASIHGTTLWATLDDAALVNGVTAHGLELDDTFEESSLHPAVVVFPAVLALADERGYSAADVLRAAAVGYDVMCSAGVLLGAAESYGRGFHPTGVAGVLGAAAAVSSLFRLDEDQTTHALSLAANLAAGSLEFLSDGSWTKRLNAGHAASGGLRAGKLAAADFTAPETSIEGRDGFLNQYGQGLIEGRRLNLVFGKSALDTSIKFYPAADTCTATSICCATSTANTRIWTSMRSSPSRSASSKPVPHWLPNRRRANSLSTRPWTRSSTCRSVPPWHWRPARRLSGSSTMPRPSPRN